MFYATDQHHGLKHNPFKSLVVPRPIGWVSTVSPDGARNLAPFSYFNALATDPPVVVFGCNGAHAEGGVKDSLDNTRATGEFVVNIATWELKDQMNTTSAQVGRGVDEFAEAGLTPAPATLVKAPRVAESPVNLECRLLQILDLPSRDPAQPNSAVLGQVVGVHIEDAIVRDGMIDMTRFRPIARLGYMDYTVVDTVFTMGRPG